MIKVYDLQYQYHDDLFHFNFDIKEGSIVAVLGGSGAGKSTLLSLLAGFITPMSGDAIVNASSIITLAPYQRPLSMLFQEHNLFNHLTVYENIALGLNPKLKLTTDQQQKIKEISKQVKVDSLLSRLPTELSGGQKQRVALARSFAQDKPLLLLDEPFSALDPILRKNMLNIVSNLAKNDNRTVLMVTHHLNDALNVASHFVFVDEGRGLEIEPIENLKVGHKNKKLSAFIEAGSY